MSANKKNDISFKAVEEKIFTFKKCRSFGIKKQDVKFGKDYQIAVVLAEEQKSEVNNV